jgi:hypothetical protein
MEPDGCTPQDGPDEPAEPPEGPASPSMPIDPFGAGRVPLVALHEGYLNLRAGGFEWHEALFYLAANMNLNALLAQQQFPPEQEP